MIKDSLTGIESKYAVNGVYVPKECFFVCPMCAESADMFVSENPKCPVCDVPYIISTPISYEQESNKPFRYNISALKDKVLKITMVGKIESLRSEP